MKRLFALLLLAPAIALAQSVPNGTIVQGQIWTPAQWNAAWQAKADISVNGVNAATPTYGVLCDGSSDDYQHLTNAIAAVPTGGVLYIPPGRPGACLVSQALVISKSMALVAPGPGVVIKPTAGNTSNPVLINVNAATGPVLIYGITFDGGGTNFANTNNVVQEFNSSLVTFDHIIVQNTRGIGLLVSSSVQSGVQFSNFINIGMHWQTSLSGTDRYQAVAFCCTSPTQSAKNFVIGNYFHNVGLDSISMTGQLDYLIENNRCDLALSTPQFVTLAGQAQYPACVFVSANTAGVIVGNVSDSAPGNAFDIGTNGGHANLTVQGNFATTTGGAGAAISATNDFSVTGNVFVNGNQNSGDCHLGAISFANTNTIGTISGNTMTDTQGSPTQNYGIYSFTGCSNPATLTNIFIDPSNMVAGNKTAGYGGGLSGPTMGATTANWNLTLAPSAGVPLTLTAPSGSFAMVINPANGVDAFQIIAPSGQISQSKWRGNGNSGGLSGRITQDASSVFHIANDANAALNLDVNGANAVAIAPSTKSATFTGPIVSGGSAYAIASGTGACSSTANKHGTTQAGDFQCTGTTGAATATLTLTSTGGTGWVCPSPRDVNSGAVGTQTGAISPTSVTFTFTTVTANDVIQFACPPSY